MSADPATQVRIDDRAEDGDDRTSTRDTLGEMDNDVTTPTPKVTPVAVHISSPSTVLEEAAGKSTPADGYFIQDPAASEQAHSMISSNTTPSPSVSASDVTATGQIQTPDALLSAGHAERPSPYTTASSWSVQTTDSAATVTAASSIPALASTAQVRPPFPNQSYAALSYQQHPAPYPAPTLKQRSSHPGQIYTFTSALASLHQSGSRTVGNSPAVTPGSGLFCLQPPLPTEYDAPGTPGTYASPYLHFTQRVPPKETHVADVDVDPVSGRKLINHYEIIDELGRGTHGKVKLGRDLTDGTYVAIKIVERFSRRRKLGKLGTTEDKVKKEVAILKQARHPNVVALLEVIDDPSRKKVYIVLEWVERGEIQWRAKAQREVAMVEARRYERERSGKRDEQLETVDAAILAEAQRRLAKRRRRQLRTFRQMRRDASNEPEAWSIELMGDDMSEVSDDDGMSLASAESSKLVVDNTRRGSRAPSPLPPRAEDAALPTAHQYLSLTSEPRTLSPTTSRHDFGDLIYTGLEGTMYGAYVPNVYESRIRSANGSIHSLGSRPTSRTSADSLPQLAAEVLDSDLNPDLEYVPLMTMQQTRVAFRDTLLGLQYLHYQGIVHRDIKPPNLLATKDHRVKISDFGVSYLGRPIHEGDPGEDVSEHETQDLDDETKELAKTVGTPAFYPPELCSTEQVDDPLPVTKAIDVWALGITLFCMLFARTPFVDNEFVVMRQIADEEIYIPRQRLVPVEPKPRSRPSSHGRFLPPQSSGYRHELDLVYEEISDELYDLLRRLLTKDPRKRITLEEVRHHAWVVADIQDRVAWLEETDPNRQSQGKKIEVSKEDITTAVVPLFFDRVRTGIKRVGEKLGFGSSSKSTGRGRASSNVAAGDGGSPAPSNASTGTSASREGRSSSLRGDDSILTALKASREGEHPLSRSVAASPELEKHDVDHDSQDGRSDSASATMEQVERSTPSRPNLPERASTVMATGGSMRTVRQSDYRRSMHEDSPPPSPGFSEAPTPVDSPAPGGGWGSGVARRIMRSVRERSTGRSMDARATSSDRHSLGSIDTHGGPSLALSPTTAAGQVSSPDVDEMTPYSATSSPLHSPSVSRPVSIPSSPSGDRLSPLAAEAGSLSRVNSSGSVSSVGRRAVLGNLSRSPVRSRLQSQSRHIPPESTAIEWKRAEDEHIRKLVRENEMEAQTPQSPFDNRMCPPSPDDHHPSSRPDSRKMSELDISAPDSSLEASPTGHGAQIPTPLISSTSDFGSTVSASMSNPSIPSAISEASSVDLRDTVAMEESEQKTDLMSSGETVLPLYPEAQDEGYIADHNDNALSSDNDDAYDSSSDSDGGLVMSRRKSAAKAQSPVIAKSSSTIAGRRGTGLSARAKKSSRSGSSNTMKKTGSQEGKDEFQRPSLDTHDS